jgi:hypothetical protein
MHQPDDRLTGMLVQITGYFWDINMHTYRKSSVYYSSMILEATANWNLKFLTICFPLDATQKIPDNLASLAARRILSADMHIVVFRFIRAAATKMKQTFDVPYYELSNLIRDVWTLCFWQMNINGGSCFGSQEHGSTLTKFPWTSAILSDQAMFIWTRQRINHHPSVHQPLHAGSATNMTTQLCWLAMRYWIWTTSQGHQHCLCLRVVMQS